MQQQEEQKNSGGDGSSERLHFAQQARACPHDWGSDVQPVLHALNHPSNNKGDETTELFDVVLAADCCYMPWTHDEMLDSIYKVLSPIGVALVCFALHDNTDDSDVWRIVDRAKNRGFVVETLPSTQLTPPTTHMEAKQGLVHTVRLSKPQ
jgi:predicted nicotinamide N-methyase